MRLTCVSIYCFRLEKFGLCFQSTFGLLNTVGQQLTDRLPTVKNGNHCSLLPTINHDNCFLLQAAVGFDYEGKTEAHASQKGTSFYIFSTKLEENILPCTVHCK